MVTKATIAVHTDRKTGRSALFVSTTRGEVIAEWTPNGWRISALVDGRPSPDGIETLLELEASPRWAEWIAANTQATSEAMDSLAAEHLRASAIPRLILYGGPATGGTRWVRDSSAKVGIVVARAEELLHAAESEDLASHVRRKAALELSVRPRPNGQYFAPYAVTEEQAIVGLRVRRDLFLRRRDLLRRRRVEARAT